ncbi:Thiamine kinase [Zhongshania aliphaticivorans]|uniref:Thiamine kinase n=1 Tax=Zhongshania aliphaticivorans TaxID=1470434 RepID=A0A5S9NKB8_9GAMM|nr:choline kinase family protein [Zhongshania aliphaticivorans]CAA0090612.1 Thiamine kinase [Zhongshania aliphaticivorans]CAA0098112.1 Thiamine kinase [Zhongshania aliphaticivorans]
MMSRQSAIIPADWHLWSREKPSLIRPLLGGLTNKSYLISADGVDMVLRENSALSAALNLDRKVESQVMRSADSAELCAPLVHYDAQNQYMVSRYVQGGDWQADNAGLQSLAQLLQRIHSLPAVEGYLDINVKAEHYWSEINIGEEFYDDLKKLSSQVIPHIKQAEKLNTACCVCHNDLLLENLIVSDDGCLYAIDWEYAAMGDAFYELAVIVEGHSLDEGKQQLLLSKYLQRSLLSKDWQRLYHWRIIYCYLTVLWYAVQFSVDPMGAKTGSDNIVEQIQALQKLIKNGAV